MIYFMKTWTTFFTNLCHFHHLPVSFQEIRRALNAMSSVISHFVNHNSLCRKKKQELTLHHDVHQNGLTHFYHKFNITKFRHSHSE